MNNEALFCQSQSLGQFLRLPKNRCSQLAIFFFYKWHFSLLCPCSLDHLLFAWGHTFCWHDTNCRCPRFSSNCRKVDKFVNNSKKSQFTQTDRFSKSVSFLCFITLHFSLLLIVLSFISLHSFYFLSVCVYVFFFYSFCICLPHTFLFCLATLEQHLYYPKVLYIK